MLRRILLSIFISITSLSVYSQSIDDKIVIAMNSSDWLALDSIYNSVPKDSIDPFIEVCSRCLIGNTLNRPDVSIPAFQELFSTQSEELDIDNTISFAYLYGKDLNRTGQNERAASVITSILDTNRQYFDSVTVSGLTSEANRYRALAAYDPYQIQFNGDGPGYIPFSIVPIGPADKGSVLMHLEESSINGKPADIIFDTGMVSSIISPEMVEKYNLIPLENKKISVYGVGGEEEGHLAIAKELQLGNITVRDVPFIVVPISSDNSEANQYLDSIHMFLGNDVMLQLKDITIDFVTNHLTIPSKAPFIPVKTDARPNMCLSTSTDLLCRGIFHNDPMLMHIDSGNASYGIIGEAFFENNKQYVMDNGIKETVRQAGIGGVNFPERYILSNTKISLGGHTAEIPEIDVRTNKEPGAGSQFDANIGLRTLMLYSSVRFNFVDFVLTTEVSRNAHIR